jgi:hypothetical protein
MTQCPKCGRAYAENFSYCLDDGTPLRHSTADEKTLVMPQSPQSPQPPPPTVPMQTPTPTTVPPRVATPTTTSSNKSIFGAVALGVVGLFLVVFVWGAIKLGFWYLDRNQTSNQNSSSAPSSTATGPTPSPENPLSLLGASPSPSPESSVDLTATEGMIVPGVYECEVTREVTSFTIMKKGSGLPSRRSDCSARSTAELFVIWHWTFLNCHFFRYVTHLS